MSVEEIQSISEEGSKKKEQERCYQPFILPTPSRTGDMVGEFCKRAASSLLLLLPYLSDYRPRFPKARHHHRVFTYGAGIQCLLCTSPSTHLKRGGRATTRARSKANRAGTVPSKGHLWRYTRARRSGATGAYVAVILRGRTYSPGIETGRVMGFSSWAAGRLGWGCIG